jgi:hypothetical protein
MTMSDWLTDAQLYDTAERLGKKIVEMYTHAGKFIGAGTVRDGVMDGVRYDAEIFMSLDPQRIIDEFQRMQRAARDTGDNAEAAGHLRTAGSHLTANWHGGAADRFAQQMSYAETFMEQQQRELAFAAHSMGTAYSLAVHARRNYHNLAEATIAQCDNEIAAQTGRTTKAAVGMLGEIAKSCITGFSVAVKAGEVTVWALENFVSIAAKGGEIMLEGDECEKVTASYNRGQRQLTASFEDGLNEVRKWVDTQEGELAKDKIPLLEPLPLDTDVNGADFSYGKFFHEDRSRDTFSPRVEEQRKKPEQHQDRPVGLIGRRLSGGR